MEEEELPYSAGDDPEVLAVKKLLQATEKDAWGNKSPFLDFRGRPLKIPYYTTQLQVILDYWYHWIVYNALKLLVEEEFLATFQIASQTQNKIVFYHNAALQSENEQELLRTHARGIADLIDEHSVPQVSRALGKHLEGLVSYELRVEGFEIVATHTQRYKGRTWSKSEHDLDIIAEHRSGNLAIGVEVKNTLQVIDRKLLETKIRICDYLGLRPLFAVRWNKPYLELVREAGGFSWMFRDQFFPPGMESLANRLRDRLKLPTLVSTQIPPWRVAVFRNWVHRETI